MTFPGENNTIPFPLVCNDSDTLGGRLWRARDALGLSIEIIAARLGLPEETVTGWERDRSEPDSRALPMLAGLLAVSPAWLVAGIGTAPAAPTDDSPVEQLMHQLSEVRQLFDRTGKALAALETEVARLIKKDQG
ncbi:helix-turn-helix domain-containing protein [Shinella sp.]|uniref:helix-turn-helix domain-containing protein n=1 Tax=Shinella sp. TaxID=1870904 RepID=UPI0039E5C1D8